MQIVHFTDLDFIPASHEDPNDPGALKKVLLTKTDLPEGRIQMINWAQIPIGKTFAPHYHEKMVEVFIIMNGKVKAKISAKGEPSSGWDSEEEILEKGNCNLPTFLQSQKIHLKLLESLLQFLNKNSKKKYDYYPFT